MFDAEVAEVDQFIAEYKELDGYLQPWSCSYGRDWQARWGINDALGIQRAELCLTVDARLEKPTIAALLNRRLIYRLDLVPASECKIQHYGARGLGLPHQVCGPHAHLWASNREFVRINGFAELPFRVPVDVGSLDIAQALVLTADHLNLTLKADQRDVRLPDQPRLFKGGSV